MGTLKVRHTVTLDPDVVRRAHRLRRGTSLSTFLNDALIAYTADLELAAYKAQPLTATETAMAQASAESFSGDDDQDWEALYPASTPRRPKATVAATATRRKASSKK